MIVSDIHNSCVWTCVLVNSMSNRFTILMFQIQLITVILD